MTGPVDDYIRAAPDDHCPALREIRGMIQAAIPKATEVVASGFPVYTVGGQWTAGFASRTKGVMLYIMANGVLDDHADALGKLRTGRSCVEYRASEDLTLDALKDLARKMLREAGKRTG